MAKSFDELVTAADDAELCSGAFVLIREHFGTDADVAHMDEDARTVLLVQHVFNVVGEGGFRRLFEDDIKGDPHFVLAAGAFDRIHCLKACDAIRKTMALFPGSLPPKDVDARVNRYDRRANPQPTVMDQQFKKAGDEVTTRLADYIRSRAETLRWLLTVDRNDLNAHGQQPKSASPYAQAASGPASMSGSSANSSNSAASMTIKGGSSGAINAVGAGGGAGASPSQSGQNFAELPKWARAAFAAHCARQVLPLFGAVWREAPAGHAASLMMTLDLAEFAAAEGDAPGSLQGAAAEAMKIAAEAQTAKPGLSGAVAALVAKATAKAAETIYAPAGAASASVEAAREAWGFAREAARLAQENDVVRLIEQDLEKIRRAAVKSKWTDQTRVPAEIWGML